MIDQDRVEKLIVDEVTSDLVGDDRLRSLISGAVERRIDMIFAEQAETAIREAVSNTIREGFDRSFSRTDNFGRQTGEPTTISRELGRMVDGYWNEKVDDNGKAVKESYGSSGKLTRAEYVMLNLAKEDFKGQMTQHVANLGGALKDSLRASLRSTLDELLSVVFHVRSLDDQRESATKRGQPRYGAVEESRAPTSPA